jgi:hypothetical protein
MPLFAHFKIPPTFMAVLFRLYANQRHEGQSVKTRLSFDRGLALGKASDTGA